jgi:hypothetical protein
LDFVEIDQRKLVLLGLSLAGYPVKPLLSLYGTEWRERGYGLCIWFHLSAKVLLTRVQEGSMRGSLGLKNTALIDKAHLDPLRKPLLPHQELGISSHHFKTVALCPHQEGLEGLGLQYR